MSASTTTASAAPAPRRRTATPRSVRRLRRLQAAAVALLLAFGALVVTALAISFNASIRAAESLTQYERLGGARVQALEVQQAANTWALTPTDAVRNTVTEELTTLATTLADASAVDADRDRIVPLTGALVHYSMTLQDALNAKGEASAALLAQADSQLSKELLQPLESATAAAADRMAGELTANWLGWVIGGAVVAAGGLVGVLIALARVSHRYLNPGVALALLCALGSVAVLTLTTNAASGAASGFADGSRAEVDAVANVRQQLHQARADELLAVGLRAAGGTYQQRWTTSITAARRALVALPTSTSAVADLDAYSTAHQKVVAATGRSQWDTATGLVTGTGAGTAGKTFNSVDGSLNTINANLRGPAISAVRSVENAVVGGIAGVIVLTLGGVWLAVWGVARRLEEYR